VFVVPKVFRFVFFTSFVLWTYVVSIIQRSCSWKEKNKIMTEELMIATCRVVGIGYKIKRSEHRGNLYLPLALTLTCPVLGTFVKFRKTTNSFVMSVRPSVRPDKTTRLPLDRFSWNLIFENSSKICRENSSFITICQQ